MSVHPRRKLLLQGVGKFIFYGFVSVQDVARHRHLQHLLPTQRGWDLGRRRRRHQTIYKRQKGEREKDEVGTSKQTKKESESLVKVIYDSTNDQFQKQESFVTQNSLCQKEIRKFKIKIKCTFKVTVNS